MYDKNLINAMIAFCDCKGDEVYDWMDGNNCACAQFAKAINQVVAWYTRLIGGDPVRITLSAMSSELAFMPVGSTFHAAATQLRETFSEVLANA